MTHDDATGQGPKLPNEHARLRLTIILSSFWLATGDFLSAASFAESCPDFGLEEVTPFDCAYADQHGTRSNSEAKWSLSTATTQRCNAVTSYRRNQTPRPTPHSPTSPSLPLLSAPYPSDPHSPPPHQRPTSAEAHPSVLLLLQTLWPLHLRPSPPRPKSVRKDVIRRRRDAGRLLERGRRSSCPWHREGCGMDQGREGNQTWRRKWWGMSGIR